MDSGVGSVDVEDDDGSSSSSNGDTVERIEQGDHRVGWFKFIFIVRDISSHAPFVPLIAFIRYTFVLVVVHMVLKRLLVVLVLLLECCSFLWSHCCGMYQWCI